VFCGTLAVANDMFYISCVTLFALSVLPLCSSLHVCRYYFKLNFKPGLSKKHNTKKLDAEMK